jgi:hypothetical protein
VTRIRTERNVKVKVTHLHTCADTEGWRRKSCNLLVTSALERMGGQHHAPGYFTPRKRYRTYCALWNGLDRNGKFHLHRDSIPDRSPRRNKKYKYDILGTIVFFPSFDLAISLSSSKSASIKGALSFPSTLY